MKKITIGRGRECDIRISDSTDKVSRRQAVITFSPTGKMLIYDTSANGTFVNGEKVVKPEPLPVRRGDNVNFAHTADLDWSLVKNPYRKSWGMFIAFIVSLIVIAGIILIWGESIFSDSKEVVADDDQIETLDSIVPANDSLKLMTPADNPSPVAPAQQTPKAQQPNDQAKQPGAKSPATSLPKNSKSTPTVSTPATPDVTPAQEKPESKAPETDYNLLEQMKNEKK